MPRLEVFGACVAPRYSLRPLFYRTSSRNTLGIRLLMPPSRLYLFPVEEHAKDWILLAQERREKEKETRSPLSARFHLELLFF